MNATERLHDQRQSLWLDNIARDLLDTSILARYVERLSVTGLTSHPTIFDHAIKNSSASDAAIRTKVKEGKSGEALFFELALEDLTLAAAKALHAKGGTAEPPHQDPRHKGSAACHRGGDFLRHPHQRDPALLCSPGVSSGTSTPSISGGRARQGAGPEHHPGAREPDRACAPA
jgi:hypothetical protein